MRPSPETADNALYLHQAGPEQRFPPFERDGRTGIAIVGGGLTGLSTALHLAEAGHDVTVLEAEVPGWGASGRNGGQLNPGLKFNPSWFLEHFGEAQGRKIVDFAWSTVEETATLVERLGIDCGMRRCGTLRAATSEREAGAVRASYEDMRAHGMPLKWLDKADLAAETGHEVYHSAFLDPRGGEVNPLQLSRGLADAAAQRGAALHGASRVTALRRAGNGWELETNGATLRADRVLVACNGYADRLVPGLRQAAVPVFSSALASNPLSGSLAKTVFPSRRVLYEAGLVTVYYRVDPDGHLIIGGRGPMRPSSAASDMTAVANRAFELWPELAGHGWKHAWNGRVCITKDHLPHIHAPDTGLLIAYGYNGRGVALATVLGQHLAAALAHRSGASDLVIPPSSMRKIPFHPFWPVGVKAAVTYARLRARFSR